MISRKSALSRSRNPLDPTPEGMVRKNSLTRSFQPGFHLVHGQVGSNQSHAAIDVEPDTARRDHSFFGVKGRHAPDGEAVTAMSIGHAQGVPLNARQAGDIADLINNSFVYPLDQRFRGKHQRRNPHPRFASDRHLPDSCG